MTEKNEEGEFVSLRDASEYAKVTRQAIYVAIKKKKLTAVKRRGRWCIFKKDLHSYQLNKHNRHLRVVDGERIYDPEKGLFSIPEVCMMISTKMKQPYSIQHLYYLVRSGQLKAFKRGSAWVISKEAGVELAIRELGYVQAQTEMAMN